MKNGHVVEFRLHLREMDEATIDGRKFYLEQRTLEAISKTRKLKVEELKTQLEFIRKEFV